MAAEGDKTVVQPPAVGAGKPAPSPDVQPTLPTVGAGAHTQGTLAGLGATTRDVAPPTIPDVELQGQIGRGGMGVVWRGRQTYLDRPVAVKLLLIDEQRGGAEYVRRFQREARILAGLSHPHIVACYQAGLTPQERLPYLVMEFIDGPNLRDHLRQHGPLPVREALLLVRDLAHALAHAEQAGIIHRDIKPENVLLANRREAAGGETPWVAKLVDLGLARPASRAADGAGSDMHLTQQGVVMGTPATMAPEQFGDPDHVDYRADLYGLGCVLFHALTGRPAFPQTSLGEILSAKVSGTVPDPAAVRQDLPAGVAALCRALLAREPGDRPASYRVLIADTEALLVGGGTGAGATRWLVPTLITVGAVGVGLAIAAATLGRGHVSHPAPAPAAPDSHATTTVPTPGPSPTAPAGTLPLDAEGFASLRPDGAPTPWLIKNKGMEGWSVASSEDWGVAEDAEHQLSGIHGWATHPLPAAGACRVQFQVHLGAAKACAFGILDHGGRCDVAVIQNFTDHYIVWVRHGHPQQQPDPQRWDVDASGATNIDPVPSLPATVSVRGRQVCFTVGGLETLPPQALTDTPVAFMVYAAGGQTAPVVIDDPELQPLR